MKKYPKPENFNGSLNYQDTLVDMEFYGFNYFQKLGFFYKKKSGLSLMRKEVANKIVSNMTRKLEKYKNYLPEFYPKVVPEKEDRKYTFLVYFTRGFGIKELGYFSNEEDAISFVKACSSQKNLIVDLMYKSPKYDRPYSALNSEFDDGFKITESLMDQYNKYCEMTYEREFNSKYLFEKKMFGDQGFLYEHIDDYEE